MMVERYEIFDDPYLYPGTDVLINKLDLKNAEDLENFELEMTTLAASEALPDGALTEDHYRAIHLHLFGDVYEWAGKYRTVRMAKGGNHFCYPENIEAEMRKQFARLQGGIWLRSTDFEVFNERVSDFLAELNAIHPFREGNGRCQLTFLTLLAHVAGYELDLTRVTRKDFLPAMISSYHGDLGPLRAQIRVLRA